MSCSCLRLALCTLCTALCSSCPRFSIILARLSQWEVRELMESVSPRSTTNSFVVFAFKLSLHFLLAHKQFVFFCCCFLSSKNLYLCLNQSASNWSTLPFSLTVHFPYVGVLNLPFFVPAVTQTVFSIALPLKPSTCWYQFIK